MICPCKDCENKGCGTYHDQCEKYQQYVEWRNYIHNQERKEKDILYGGKGKRSHRNKKNIWH